MKFITEMELRDLYKAEPFTSFVLEPHLKITPGARQFLVDRGVKLTMAQRSDDKSADEGKTIPVLVRDQWSLQRLRSRMECIESLFLLVGADLLSRGDALLAQEVMELGKSFREVKNAEREQVTPGKIKFRDWTEAEIKNCSNNLGKTFEVNEFHAQLSNGKTIALLNHLRASLREVEPAILESYWQEEQQTCLREDLIEKVNLIINILCIMMWRCLGGQKCKP